MYSIWFFFQSSNVLLFINSLADKSHSVDFRCQYIFLSHSVLRGSLKTWIRYMSLHSLILSFFHFTSDFQKFLLHINSRRSFTFLKLFKTVYYFSLEIYIHRRCSGIWKYISETITPYWRCLRKLKDLWIW